MKKRISAGILAISVFITNVAYASQVSTVTCGRTVRVTAKGADGEKIMLVVAKSGEDINDNQNIFVMKEEETDENGTVIFDFDMPNEKGDIEIGGEYDIYIKCAGKDLITDGFIYETVEKRDAALKSIVKAGNEAALSEILENPDNYNAFKSLGMNIDEYLAFSESDKSNVLPSVVKYCKNLQDSEYESARTYFNAEIARIFINSAEKKDITKYIIMSGLTFEEKSFSEITDDKLIDFIAGNVYSYREYSSAAELEKRYISANMLYIINNTRFSDIESVLKKYAAELGLDFMSGYNAYLRHSNKLEVSDKLASELKTNPANDAAELNEKINVAVKSVKEYEKNQNTGGGSGSGITSTIPVGKTETVKPENKPEDSKKIFSDLDQVPWAEQAINKLAAAGVVSGKGNGLFSPNDYMTREEFVKMIVAAIGKYNPEAECEFDDVPKESWYYTYVASAFEENLVFGVSDSRFGVGSLLTRQDMAVICSRAAERVKEIESVKEYQNFADEEMISDYAKSAVNKLYRAGVVNGSGDTFNPLNNATRAEGAMIIYNLFLK